MTFWAFDAVELDGGTELPGTTHAEVMAWVAAAGVRTAADTTAGLAVAATVAEAQRHVDRIAALRAALPFGIDGVLVKLNDLGEQAAAGSGSRHPHWATAYKLPAVERRTRLLEVTWSVGRAGADGRAGACRDRRRGGVRGVDRGLPHSLRPLSPLPPSGLCRALRSSRTSRPSRASRASAGVVTASTGGAGEDHR